MLTDDLVRRLYRKARADRWALPVSAFSEALEASAAARRGEERSLEGYLSSLHLEDLALAAACAAGQEAAWEHFIREQRPVLYRAADALDPGGGTRELADALYADLYGLRNRKGERRSLFRYFHGRSSLSTWLRAVLAQRHVDRARSARRFDPLPDEEAAPAVGRVATDPDLDRERHSALMQRALDAAVGRLSARDRLRLGCYYVQELTLAETGRALREHEATVSRQLARTRRAIKEDVEQSLRDDAGLTADEIAQCFRAAADDPGALDLDRMLRDATGRKISQADRSIDRESL